MYLRETKRKNGDRSVISYYQLAENEWDKEKGCAVARVIYTVGSHVLGTPVSHDHPHHRVPRRDWVVVPEDRERVHPQGRGPLDDGSRAIG